LPGKRVAPAHSRELDEEEVVIRQTPQHSQAGDCGLCPSHSSPMSKDAEEDRGRGRDGDDVREKDREVVE